MSDPLAPLLNQRVVLDTGTSIIYIGLLTEYTENLFVLRDADLHDCRDGHLSKEAYLADICRSGLTANRGKVIVMRSAVMSLSPLAEVVAD
jgi:hypothetical protein